MHRIWEAEQAPLFRRLLKSQNRVSDNFKFTCTMKQLELTMKVIEDRSAPMMLTEKNLPGFCCCTCCCSCCLNLGESNTNGDTSATSSPGA